MVFVRRHPGGGRSWWLFATLGLAACADPATRFEEFGTRYNELNPPIPDYLCEGNPCAQPAPGAIDGSYLWTVSTEVGPTTPVLFHAVLTTVAAGDGLELSFTAAPLDSGDRTTEAGPAVDYGPIAISAAGCFETSLHVEAPGAANPITGTDLAADLDLAGQLCADVDPLICGTITGAVTVPVALDLTSSNFTFDQANGPGDYTEPPILNCAGELADPI
jgi:hypothetical protein